MLKKNKLNQSWVRGGVKPKNVLLTCAVTCIAFVAHAHQLVLPAPLRHPSFVGGALVAEPLAARSAMVLLFIGGELLTTLVAGLPQSTGFIQKNPFRIHKLFSNLCNMAWKSNIQVLNSSTHQVKGHNPYYSRWPCIQSAKTDRKCGLCDFAQHFLKNWFFNYCSVLGNAVSD